MSDQVKKTTVNVVPTARYRDAPKAVDWLCRAFGFEPYLVVPDGADGIAHAELVFGNGMVMLSSVHDNEFDDLVKPLSQGGHASQSIYVIVEDADLHHDRAVAAGAEVVMQLKDQDYGGRGYTCRDLEGNIWSFGTFDPWSPPSSD
jgi:uncharacterized glyoxalase superfamily protein PhnB